MYGKMAKVYDNLHHFKEFDSLTQKLESVIEQYRPGARSILEVACGTGQFLRRLMKKYEVEGVDSSPEMLAVAAAHCPRIPLHETDMVELSLSGRFDVVACLFSSICYVRTADRMNRAVERMAEHLNPGGILLIEPHFSPETIWRNDVRLNTYDGPDQKIAWMYTTRVEGRLAIADYHFLVGEETGVEHFVERHEFGLFTDAEYRASMERLGLKVSYDAVGVYGRGMYVGSRRR